jgi:type IX secretion system PorP/SprF family membrane protein
MRYLIYFFLLGVVNISFGQQEKLFSQYMFNPATFNPAYTGSRGVNSLFFQHRSQWVNIEGAPNTSFLNYQIFSESKKTGLGLSFTTDQLGALKRTETSIDFAYHLKINDKGKLALGLKLSGDRLKVDFSGINQYQEDQALFVNIDRNFSPNIGAGLYYYTDKYFFGASIPRFLETSHYDNSELSNAKDRMHFYLMSGYVFDVNPDIKFKPMMFYRLVNNMGYQLDVAGHFLINEKFQIGGTYRFVNAYSFMSAFQINPSVIIGYSYDRETTDLAAFNKGSHEIFIRYEFVGFSNGKLKIQSPRFF